MSIFDKCVTFEAVWKPTGKEEVYNGKKYIELSCYGRNENNILVEVTPRETKWKVID